MPKQVQKYTLICAKCGEAFNSARGNPVEKVFTPHGRLIDIDALQRKIIETVNSGEPDEQFTALDVIQLIENAPTIIEAEG